MNNTPFWASATFCLTWMMCAPPASAEEMRQRHASAFYSEDIDCSGLAGPIPMESPAANTPPRLPYGFRWDDYQGAEVEHDVYGDRQRASNVRPCPHAPLGPAVARRFAGLFAVPGPRANVMVRSAPVMEQCEDDPADCGCEKPQASPLAPALVPVPPDTVPAIPDEPTPAEPSLVPPRNVVPPRKQSAATRPEAKHAKRTAPLPQPKVARPTISMRLIPIQILAAAPPAGVSATKAPVVRANELRRNKIPAISTKDSTIGETGKGLTDFFNELLGTRR